MKCFEHHEVDAIGICTHCGKGACPDCIKVSATQVACCRDCLKEITWNKGLAKLKTEVSIVRSNRTILLAKVSIVIGIWVAMGFGNGAGTSLIALGIFAYVWASLNVEYVMDDKE